jgi:hypothetical protein
MATATATYDQSVGAFPSIVIGPDRTIEPQGSFAEAQAQVCTNRVEFAMCDVEWVDPCLLSL